MLALSQNLTMIMLGNQTPFFADGGVQPYTFTVEAGGAGGSIDSVTGIYTAPNSVDYSVPQAPSFDTIMVTDAVAATATTTINVGNAYQLVCDIIQSQMNLPGRVWLWDQKIDEPTDQRCYVVVQNFMNKPFGNTSEFDADGNEIQHVNMYANLSIDIKSRGPEARDRKEEVLMALASTYSQQQQTANSFLIAKIPNAFVDLSQLDASAIPYRFNISVAIQYVVTKSTAIPYFDTFADAVVTTEA